MALRLRRGTDAQRALITPAEGELIYVTDTNEIYVGDGTTVGGVRITGEVVNEIGQLNDVDAALPQDGHILIYDSPTGDWVSGELPLVDLADVNAVGITDGQILAWDATAQAFIPANNAFSNNFVGDVVGSVFGDDSGILVDSISATIHGEFIGKVNTPQILDIDATALADGESVLQIRGFKAPGPQNSGIGINTKAARNDGSGNPVILEPGDTVKDIIAMGYDGTNYVSCAVIKMGVDKYKSINPGQVPGRMIFAAYKEDGTFGVDTLMVFNSDGALSIGAGDAPEAKLHVAGDAKFNNGVTAPSFQGDLTGSVLMDDSTVLIDQLSGTITSNGFVQFGSYTTAERDAITATNGMVIYNSSTDKFQGYAAATWVDLH
jgi:hypothetical protein